VVKLEMVFGIISIEMGILILWVNYMLCIVLKMQLKNGEVKTQNKFGGIKNSLIFAI